MDTEDFVRRAVALTADDGQGWKHMALEAFRYQSRENPVYRRYLEALGRSPEEVERVEDIPFLPIGFFKTHRVTCGDFEPQAVFLSSGTTGMTQSRHYVRSLENYRRSFTASWELHYGPIRGRAVLALLPSYLEREGSSLIEMAEGFIRQSGHAESGFYLYQHRELYDKLNRLADRGERFLLLGVSFALLDFAEKYRLQLPEEAIVMETGGMKGRREEMTREQLHAILREGFGVEHIHSEYGMTELLSQAYSRGEGLYTTPPWMRVMLRDATDPLSLLPEGCQARGGINIVDLANIDSCCFIATEDLGAIHPDGRFEVLGRLNGAEVRGCNLLVAK